MNLILLRLKKGKLPPQDQTFEDLRGILWAYTRGPLGVDVVTD